MQKITRSALVQYSSQQMFELVEDINSYKQFVPYCQDSKILEKQLDQVTAQLVVAKSGIAKSFTTINSLHPHQLIKMALVDGPFSHLSGTWKFIPLSPSACKIELDIEFDFSNKLTSLAFSKIFNKLISSMVSAFTERAEKVYG